MLHTCPLPDSLHSHSKTCMCCWFFRSTSNYIVKQAIKIIYHDRFNYKDNVALQTALAIPNQRTHYQGNNRFELLETKMRRFDIRFCSSMNVATPAAMLSSSAIEEVEHQEM